MKSRIAGALVIALALVGGCEGTLSGAGDTGSAPRDGGRDARAALDGSDVDGTVPRDAWTGLDAWTDVDAQVELTDAWVDVDAAVEMDAGRDAGPPDTGPRDSGPRDSGPRDSGPRDSGPPDTGPRDSGPRDSGPRDAGTFRASPLHNARAIGYMSAPQGFWEYVPPSAAAGPSPLLLFFHGLGENGDGSIGSLDQLLSNGPPRFIDADEWPEDRPFVVLSPQQSSGCPSAASITAFLAWALTHYDIDPTRIYLTGLSCGAIGIANYLRTHVDTTQVAAVVAISGDWRGAWMTQMCDLGRVATWAIHGDADTNGGTLPDFSRIPINNLIACPAPPREDAQLTMLPGVGHNDRAWDDTYSGANGLDVYSWLLAYSR